MVNVQIKNIPRANDPGDPKGNVWNWNQPDGHAVTVLERKAGVKFGGHYHADNDPSKNPERLFIAQGRVMAVFESQNCEREEYVLEKGQEILIHPHTRHAFLALEDCTIIEFRCTWYNKENPDTHPVRMKFPKKGAVR